jgi:hypothetical protein
VAVMFDRRTEAREGDDLLRQAGMLFGDGDQLTPAQAGREDAKRAFEEVRKVLQEKVREASN